MSGAVCLFCPANYTDFSDILNHMNIVHFFDYGKLKSSLSLNFYQQIKVWPCAKKKMISFPQTKIISNLSSADKLNGCVNLYFLSLEFKPAVDICKKKGNYFQKQLISKKYSKYHGSKNSALTSSFLWNRGSE